MSGINRTHIVLFISLALGLCACMRNEQFVSKPNAYGESNQVVVIADDAIYNEATGDTLRNYFSSSFPILPQPEPQFDLLHFTPTALSVEPVRKELRTYIIVADLSDEDSPTTKLIRNDLTKEKLDEAKAGEGYNVMVGRDKWAQGQILFYIFGYSTEALNMAIADRYASMAHRIREFDRPQIEGYTYGAGTNPILQNEVKDYLGLNLKIPKEYMLAVKRDSTVWMRKETAEYSTNIILSRIRYARQTQLSQSGVQSIRDSIGKRLVTTNSNGSFMKTNDVDLPVFSGQTDFNGFYCVEARGIWEMEGDFMGGPFLSYLCYDENDPYLVFVDGFIYAPNKDKRDQMQQLEYLIKSLDL